MDKNLKETQNFFSNILFVSELPKETKEEDLESLFKNYHFLKASLNNSKMNKIWAQVILENEEWANKARQELNGFFLIPRSANNDKSKGKPIRICKFESKYSPNNNKNIDSKRNLLVTNLDTKMTQMEFYNIFIKYGDISSGKIEYDENGISKGYGYIYYYDESSAEKAKENLNNKEFYGKNIRVVNLIPGKFKKNNNNNLTIFVLNLPNNITEKEIKSIFDKYGKIVNISLTNKGFAFINYETYKAASECLSDIKNHPISFSGLPNLIVKFATSKEEREANKNSYKNNINNDDLYKMFFKLIDNGEEIRNIYDLDKKIRLFIKIIFVTEYIPAAVEVNEKIRCGIVTFNNIKHCQIFIQKFKEYCTFNRPMFNCIPYNIIKSEIKDSFINLDNYSQNIKNDNIVNPNTGNNIGYDDLSMKNYKSNSTQNLYGSGINDNNNYNNLALSNDVLFNNKKNNNNPISNNSQMNNFVYPRIQSSQQLNNYKNNINFYNNIKQNKNAYININSNNNLNSGTNNKMFNNFNNNSLNFNNYTNNTINNSINDISNITENSNNKNNKILLKPSEFNSPVLCLYNSNNQEYENKEENIYEISDSIYQIVQEKYPNEAGKITGMIKELGFKKMNLLLSKPDDLNEIIERAYKMIMDIKDK